MDVRSLAHWCADGAYDRALGSHDSLNPARTTVPPIVAGCYWFRDSTGVHLGLRYKSTRQLEVMRVNKLCNLRVVDRLCLKKGAD